jgi:hypothetical protein
LNWMWSVVGKLVVAMALNYHQIQIQ